MERVEALERIKLLIGKDMRILADELQITVWTSEGKKNKGWVGHVIERYLGLPINSSQSPNFGSWELKVVSLVPCKRRNALRVKETMQITMIDPYNVRQKPFEESHLLAKMRKAVVVARVYESISEARSLLHSVTEFDLGDSDIYEQVKADYELVRQNIISDGFTNLTGSMGVLVQPRTKGKGHGSTSRAFYARAPFVAQILGDGYSVPLPIVGSVEE